MTALLPQLTQIPPQIAALGDYEGYARERVEPGAWAYINGGAGDEWTLRENVAAFTRLPLRTRVLRPMKGASTALTLFGCDMAAPILIAPMAFHGLVHPDGEAATALAAAATGTTLVVSTQAGQPIEHIASAAPGAPWFQLYIQPDGAFTESLVARAEAAGYRALVLTVDAPVNGVRNAEARAGFALPPHIHAVNLEGMCSLAPGPEGALLFGTPLLESVPDWQDISWLRSLTRLPILLKGIVDPEDARRALDCGVDGLIVSNHGGRTLDGVPAAIDLLPAIAGCVDRQVPVLIDGGVRRGTDVLRALALGASAVLVGRPILHALATAGALGVAHALRVLQAEFELAMALTGCRTLDEIDTGCLFPTLRAG
ncbi:MAG: alpha-hydroxy acid oxidase [Novosphingobium sp.]|uniref:alpha-hydroxy acid oxidase n=1 Tax=Novosphingobium sp. TaxID=1874826 RepID=UPI003B99D878